MDRINILYLSDLHITSKREIDQGIVLEAFFEDIRKQVDSDLAPHFIVFGGDLVNDPDESNAYEIFTEKVLLPLVDVTSVDLDNFIFTPGNHDVSRRACQDNPFDRDAIAGKFSDHKYFNGLYGSGLPQLVTQKLSRYSAFVESLSASHSDRSNIAFTCANFSSSKIAFVTINSALLSLAATAGEEQGRLAFPDIALNQAFKKIDPDHFVVSAQHHPLSWLNDTSSAEIQRTLQKKSHLHLFGHLHDAVPTTTLSPLGTTTYIQSPSLFSSRNYLNGYCLISVSPNRKCTAATFRTYFENRRAFGAGENVAEFGNFYPDADSKTFWVNQPLRINSKRFRRWLTEVALVEKSESLNDTTVGKKLADVFVCPPLVRIEPKKREAEAGSTPFASERVSYDKIFECEKNIVVFCPPEFGQTSFAKHVCLDFLIRSGEIKNPKLPLRIDFSHLRKYEASLVGLLKAQTPDLISLGKPLELILEEGLALVVIENVTPSETEKMSIVRAFMAKYAKSQFIIIVRGIGANVDALLELNIPDVSDTLHIQAFSRNLLREFIRKWKPALRVSEDVAVDQIVTRFNQLSLPLTPVYLTLLLHVFDQNPSFQPTNSALLVENFVDRLLEKDKNDVSRKSFDYKNRISLLSYYAERMMLDNLFLVEYTTLYDWTNQYLKQIGIPQDIHGLVKSFCDAGIFSLHGNSVQFRHDMFLAFFAAQRMIISQDFSRIIIEQAHRFPKEIDIYCGLKRFDGDVLDILGRKFKDVDARLIKQFPALPDLASIESFDIPRDKNIDVIFDSVGQQLSGSNLSAAERDRMLTGEAERKINQKLARPEVKFLAIEWIQTLRSYSIALKNLEEIAAEQKDEHMNCILDAWSRLVGYLILLIRTASDGKLEISGISISIEKFFGELTPLIVRWLFIAVPNLVANSMRNDLATDKLAAFFAATKPAGNSPVASRFLNEALHVDLRLPDYIRRVRELKESIRNQRFFSEALLIKLQDGYIRFPIADPENDRLYRQIMSELTAELLGKTGTEKEKAVGQQMQKLKRQELVERLRKS